MHAVISNFNLENVSVCVEREENSKLPFWLQMIPLNRTTIVCKYGFFFVMELNCG